MSTSWLIWGGTFLFLVGGPILLYGFTQADRLVRAEHDLYPDVWAHDGFPAGFFFLPPGARRRVPLKWFFRTPEWVRASPTYVKWLRRYRTCGIIWNLLCATLFFAMIYVAIHRNV
jgi:hypothetical protein